MWRAGEHHWRLTARVQGAPSKGCCPARGWAGPSRTALMGRPAAHRRMPTTRLRRLPWEGCRPEAMAGPPRGPGGREMVAGSSRRLRNRRPRKMMPDHRGAWRVAPASGMWLHQTKRRCADRCSWLTGQETVGWNPVAPLARLYSPKDHRRGQCRADRRPRSPHRKPSRRTFHPARCRFP
jgi:hypothetical protein